MESSERSVSLEVVNLLQRLLAIECGTLSVALSQACTVVSEAVGADKVDAFLHDPARASLVAVGTSTQPLSHKQRRLGLDVLPLANRGRAAEVYETGQTFVSNHVDRDPEELPGIRDALEVRSEVGVPLVIGDRRRGMVMVASQAADFFSPDDVTFVEAIARWVGLVAHRAELLVEVSRAAAMQERRQIAEEIVTELAHDLRNLLAPIASRLELLEHRARNEQRERDLRDAEAGLRTARRMNAFLSDMLDVTRLDHGLLRMESEPVDLAALVVEVAGTFTSAEIPVEVIQAGPVLVIGDRQRIRQCLENLTANAVQHSPCRAKVTLTVYRCRSDNREWGHVEVRDRGGGVAADILPHIFQRFVAGGESRGLGLGLYLAKQIALGHGGELTVDSSPERGTVFRLELPSATTH